MATLKRNLRRHYPGCYRVTLRGADRFAQILRAAHNKGTDRYEPSTEGKRWMVEIRDTSTGELIRYEGVHRTLKGAVASLPAAACVETAAR